MIDCFKWRHAGDPERQSSDSSESQIKQKDVLGCNMGARCHLLRPVRGLCLEETHATYSKQGKDRHSHTDEADTA
ncbi:hypothetical protein D3C79_752770 [compost metagenome]